MATIEKFGSLYFDGQPKEVGVSYNNEAISLGNTVPGKEISWVKLQSGLLIADRCVCDDISWEQMGWKSLVFGTLITIDGKTYWCRCLKVGTGKDEPNEWDAALDETGENNDLWHWKGIYFWGQEAAKYGSLYHAVRGYTSARDWRHHHTTGRGAIVGFRPALEYLGIEPCSPDALLSKKAKVYCQGGVTIEGSLVDFSNYDIMLKADSLVRASHPGISKKGRNIIVSRENITWLKEA